MTDPRSGFSDNLILWELQKIHDALTKTKEEHILNFRMIKPTEKFNFSEPIPNSSKLGLAVIPGGYELIEIAELIKEETNGNIILEPDKNTMISLMETKQGAINFDIENSIAS